MKIHPRTESTAILQKTRDNAAKIPLLNKRFVIFSDLHMGNGGSRDDFAGNGPWFQKILTDYYLPGQYDLVLNGDIEELQKFHWDQIWKRWKPLYKVFDQFHNSGRLHKTVGNHDLILSNKSFDYPLPIHESLELYNGPDSILVYHGHQFSKLLQRFETLNKLALQYIAYPLGIMNYSKSPDSRKKIKTEVKAYEASRELGLISIIGHTHRPLFESHSKRDRLKYKIENLLRCFREADHRERLRIRSEILQYQEELWEMKDQSEFHISGLYSSDQLLPCLFNSGCAIGKRGITSIEIDEEEIQLVYWYDRQRISPFTTPIGYQYYEIPGTTLRKVILNREKRDYILDKIRIMHPQNFSRDSESALPVYTNAVHFSRDFEIPPVL